MLGSRLFDISSIKSFPLQALSAYIVPRRPWLWQTDTGVRFSLAFRRSIDPYRGPVAPAIGDSNVGLLANHCVVVLGRDIEQAYLRAMSFEWRCRQPWHIAAAGGGVPMNRGAARTYGDFFNTTRSPGCSRRWYVASCVGIPAS
jgi:hypothetical protein